MTGVIEKSVFCLTGPDLTGAGDHRRRLRYMLR